MGAGVGARTGGLWQGSGGLIGLGQSCAGRQWGCPLERVLRLLLLLLPQRQQRCRRVVLVVVHQRWRHGRGAPVGPTKMCAVLRFSGALQDSLQPGDSRRHLLAGCVASGGEELEKFTVRGEREAWHGLFRTKVHGLVLACLSPSQLALCCAFLLVSLPY